MDEAVRRQLAEAGLHVTPMEEFLGLSSEEMAIIKMKLALSRLLRERRKEQKLTQKSVAERIGSSQPRIAALEGGSSGVTLDLLVEALLAVGVSVSEIGSAMASMGETEAASHQGEVSSPKKRRRSQLTSSPPIFHSP